MEVWPVAMQVACVQVQIVIIAGISTRLASRLQQRAAPADWVSCLRRRYGDMRDVDTACQAFLRFLQKTHRQRWACVWSWSLAAWTTKGKMSSAKDLIEQIFVANFQQVNESYGDSSAELLSVTTVIIIIYYRYRTHSLQSKILYLTNNKKITRKS